MSLRLLTTLIFLLAPACHIVAAERTFARSDLLGLWEVMACESLFPRQAGSPATITNSKYCFGTREAYPNLSAEAASDSVDGGNYYIVGGDILVIRTGVPSGLYTCQLDSVSSKQITWQRGELRFILRRIADTWDGRHAPKLRPRNIRVGYLP